MPDHQDFVVRYARRSDAGEIVAAIHRRVSAVSLRRAKALAREHLPLGFEVVSVTDAGRLDRQPYIGTKP